MMKHSIHSAITPSPAFDCDFVRAAQLRVAELHASTAHPVDPPNLLELEQALGEQVQKCELWAQNWRNRVYRIGWRAAVLPSPNKQSEGLRPWFNTNIISWNCYRSWTFPECECQRRWLSFATSGSM